jgi:chromosome segregation ATPase
MSVDVSQVAEPRKSKTKLSDTITGLRTELSALAAELYDKESELSSVLAENQRLRERNCWVEKQYNDIKSFGWSEDNLHKLRVLEATYSRLVNEHTASEATKKILESVPGLCHNRVERRPT